MLDTVQGDVHVLIYLILITECCVSYYYPHFTGDEIWKPREYKGDILLDWSPICDQHWVFSHVYFAIKDAVINPFLFQLDPPWTEPCPFIPPLSFQRNTVGRNHRRVRDAREIYCLTAGIYFVVYKIFIC